MTDQEYQELSQDWRHRDSLTWQMPTAIVAVVGLLASKGFELIGVVSDVIIWTIFIFATGFAVCLTVALWQNLIIQSKGSREMKSLTKRFDFCPIGSFLLLALYVFLSACLIILLIISSSESLEYWNFAKL